MDVTRKVSTRIMRRQSGLYITRYVYIWVCFFRRSSQFLEDVIAVDGKMVVQSVEMAEWFTETYYKEVIDFFMEPMNIYGNDMLAKTLKVALHKRIIHADDFLLEDEELISKLQQCNDPEVEALLSKVHRNVKVKEDRNDYDLHQKNKVRLIDPPLLREGKIVQSSVVSENIRQMSDIAYEKR